MLSNITRGFLVFAVSAKDATSRWWAAADLSCSSVRQQSQLQTTSVFLGSSSHQTWILRGTCPTSAASPSSISDKFVMSDIHSTATRLQHSFMRSLHCVAITVTLYRGKDQCHQCQDPRECWTPLLVWSATPVNLIRIWPTWCTHWHTCRPR